MSTDFRTLILPGRGNSGEKHWQSVWERRDASLQRVLQREWETPDKDEWVATVDAAIRAEHSPVILVAHSLAVITVAHWSGRHHGPVAGALLVSPTDVERADYPAGTTGFAPIPRLQLPFPTIVVASDDDPRVTPDRAAFFAKAWGARLERPGAFGHLGTASDLGEWPFGTALLDELRRPRAA